VAALPAPTAANEARRSRHVARIYVTEVTSW
jgi:hypothetical protein